MKSRVLTAAGRACVRACMCMCVCARARVCVHRGVVEGGEVAVAVAVIRVLHPA